MSLIPERNKTEAGIVLVFCVFDWNHIIIGAGGIAKYLQRAEK